MSEDAAPVTDKQQVQELLETLKWYADRNNYFQRNGPCVFIPDVDDDTLQAPALDDQGRRARDAIATAEGRASERETVL